MEFNIDTFSEKWKTAFDKLSLENKKRYEQFKQYCSEIGILHAEIIDFLKKNNFPEKYIDEILYLMDHEFSIVLESLAKPFEDEMRINYFNIKK